MFGFLKRKKEAKIAEENEARRQEEVRRKIEQEKREEKERQDRAEQEHQRRLRQRDEAIAGAGLPKEYCLDHVQTEINVPALNITNFTAVSKQRYVAFDLETTGLNPVDDGIVEIGAVLVENGNITKEYHQMVNPQIPISPEASAVNHITDSMVAGSPLIHQVLPYFLAFVGDDVLVAHNAPFDIRFIAQACMQNRFRVPLSFFDTMSLARYWPEASDKKLTSLAAAAGIETDTAHRALSDAKTVVALVNATNERRSNKKKK